MEITIEFELRDMWVGLYWRHDKIYKLKHLWICLIPCIPIHISWDMRDLPDFKEKPIWKEAESGRAAYCQHNVDCQIHCCLCHDGFIFEGMQHNHNCPYINLTNHPQE